MVRQFVALPAPPEHLFGRQTYPSVLMAQTKIIVGIIARRVTELACAFRSKSRE
jgi:hypothetical protein